MNKRLRTVQKNIHKIKLQQMGATVEVIKGIMHFVKVPVDDTIIKYVYHINDKGNYFIQRRLPYPINFGTCKSHDDVIDIIKHDIEKIKNAKHSKNFNKFIEINQNFSQVAQDFEDLYLYYNISHDQAKKFATTIEEIKNLIAETKNISNKAYFEEGSDSKI